MGEGPHQKIILSYRREDSADIVRLIFERLEKHFGKDRVFIDIDSIPVGVDFGDHIERALEDCGALVAVIGKKWTGPRRGRPARVMDADDWVRLEVETAFASRIPVIPVLVGNAQLPGPQQLPDTLAALPRRNATTVSSGRDFDAHMTRLIADLERLVGVPESAAGSQPAGIATFAALPTAGGSARSPRWELPPMLGRLALAGAGALALVSLLFVVVPALQMLLSGGDPARMGFVDAVVRVASVPAPGKIAIALLHLAVLAGTFLIHERIDRRVCWALTVPALVALFAAVYLYGTTGAAFFADRFAALPHVEEVLTGILLGAEGDYMAEKQALYDSLRAWIYFAALWNCLLLVSMVKNRMVTESAGPPAARAIA